MTEQEFLNLKKQFLFDEQTGLIRQGLSMAKYRDILNAPDEDALDELIYSYIDSGKDELNLFEDIEIIDEYEEEEED